MVGRRAYPEYKASGIEWLGEIPEHWDIRKLKYISSVKFSNVDKKSAEGEIPVSLCNYVDVYYNDYITPELDFMEATASTNEVDKFTLREGDVIITKDSETWDDIAVPAYVPSDLPGVLCGYHLAMIRADITQVDNEYLFRSFSSCGINYQYRVEASGITRYGLGKYWLDNSIFLLPPPHEQRAIAAFLDRETARIDALVEKKERQIELLKEKRSTLISHVVTKGLNLDALMKDSSIEWLGEIPEHWDALRLKNIATYNDDTLGETTDPDFEILYTDISSVDKIAGIQKKEMMTFENAPSRARRKVIDGDVIISTVRTYLRAIVPISNSESNLIVSTGFAVIRPTERFDSRFASYALRASYFVEEVVANSVGVSYPAINASKLVTFCIALPPKEEQREIAAFLDQETERIDTLIEKVQESIEKLREYRTALISAAVTGKIDVRGENP